ncbi:MAG TPA: AraC family transcriptional regulator [Verrucomicrobiae bacterium]|jgi:AraC-like DNA-binding protein|nr:AraC family transcriptional regulator [Verrucomicrobiae bacterium]
MMLLSFIRVSQTPANSEPAQLENPTGISRAGDKSAFTESEAWRDVGSGWQPLFGSFRGVGYSIEWHDFFAKREFDWAASFHPGCVELCLNLEGDGFVKGRGGKTEFRPDTAGFYFRENEPLIARRAAGQHHQFLTVEFSCPFLQKHFSGAVAMLHPIVRAALEGKPRESVSGATARLSAGQQQLIATLRQPPVYAAAQPIWYQCKALELAVIFLVQPPPEEEMFCSRQQRLAQERAENVIFLLKQNLAKPPSLEELGRKIGCSHFYLSRIFSNHTGQTITQYLRRLRMEKAAELLRSGEYNVTEAALEVGYESLSHFSQAFHDVFGCCPGLYPVATPTQKSVSPKLRRRG